MRLIFQPVEGAKAYALLPDWANRLKNYYVVIRVEKRNKAIRRRYYRLVEREKFRLACLGIDQAQIIAVCRWLSGSMRTCSRLVEPLQLTFDFSAGHPT